MAKMYHTTFKQQLMREQMQVLDKKEGRILPQTQLTEPIQVPLPSSTSIPLQVRTFQSKLSNPTNYHLRLSQERQVQEFLTNSHRSGSNICSNVSNNNSGEKYCPKDNLVINSADSAIEPDANDEIEGFWSDFPTIDSVADSGFSAALTTIPETEKDVLFPDFDASSSCPEVVTSKDIDSRASKMLTADKDRKKKNQHNEIEKRRRTNINACIKMLGELLPKRSEPFHAVVKDGRLNKGNILSGTVNYVMALRQEVEKGRQYKNESQKYKECVSELLKKIQELEARLELHNIPLPESVWTPSSKEDIQALIKQEPDFGYEKQCSTSAATSSSYFSSITPYTHNNQPQSLPSSSTQHSRSGRPVLQFLKVHSDTEPKSSSMNENSEELVLQNALSNNHNKDLIEDIVSPVLVTSESLIPDFLKDAISTDIKSSDSYSSCFSPSFVADDDFLKDDDDCLVDDVMFSRDSSSPEDVEMSYYNKL